MFWCSAVSWFSNAQVYLVKIKLIKVEMESGASLALILVLDMDATLN